MLTSLSKIFGDSNDRELKKLEPMVAKINGLESEFEQLSDEQLQGKTELFKEMLTDGMVLGGLLPQAFAAVREAAKRTLGQRHYDVQLVGGMVLHMGKIAEMRTGEGKTLVATLPTYLNALVGAGAHVITVNDYLAKRDAQWMGQIYDRLGLSVACLQHDSSFLFDPSSEIEDERMRNLRPISRQDAYGADITYGTNSEFGFDYLRDNMVVDLSQRVQRGLHYCLVDEVDNILIDEARTPLIISGQSGDSDQQYQSFAQIIPGLLVGEDYTIDEKLRIASLGQSGISKLERRLNVTNLYDQSNYQLIQYVDNALKAHAIYKRDVDYVVKDNEVVLVDEFTGRLMVGRRLSDGLHQAIEAKEGVKVQRETVTLATVTIQNYFRMYEKLAGMTGTAVTESEEFHKIYSLDVVVIPTHQPMVRQDEQDLVYKTVDAKFSAVADEIECAHGKGRPVLVGTVSIESSERLSSLLKQRGIAHNVLNAKQHESEAAIVAQAGRTGAVTVATNMAGRGTDIVLGGAKDDRQQAEWEAEHRKVVEFGGLYIIGTERHEARRIDNQLRGRSGRQGDPGMSRFYVSFEDDLMRRFGGDRVKGFMEWAGIEDNAPLQHSFVSKAIESSQTKVEGHNFDIRKRLIEYDDVVNRHREVIYGERLKVLSGSDLKTNMEELVQKELTALVMTNLSGEDVETWNLEDLFNGLKTHFPLPRDLTEETIEQLSRAEVVDAILGYARDLYDQLELSMTPEVMRVLERMVMLRAIDTHWVEHLTTMENTRQGIGLQGVAQMDPLVAYKRQGATMFGELSDRIQSAIGRSLYHSAIGHSNQLRTNNQGRAMATPSPVSGRPRVATSGEQEAMASAVRQRAQPAAALTKLGRNDPCHCGSGKKYKRCHGV